MPLDPQDPPHRTGRIGAGRDPRPRPAGRSSGAGRGLVPPPSPGRPRPRVQCQLGTTLFVWVDGRRGGRRPGRNGQAGVAGRGSGAALLGRDACDERSGCSAPRGSAAGGRGPRTGADPIGSALDRVLVDPDNPRPGTAPLMNPRVRFRDLPAGCEPSGGLAFNHPEGQHSGQPDRQGSGSLTPWIASSRGGQTLEWPGGQAMGIQDFPIASTQDRGTAGYSGHQPPRSSTVLTSG